MIGKSRIGRLPLKFKVSQISCGEEHIGLIYQNGGVELLNYKYSYKSDVLPKDNSAVFISCGGSNTGLIYDTGAV